MSEWGSSRKGHYWGQKNKSRKPQGKGGKGAPRGEPSNPKAKEQAMFPSYDTMKVDTEEPQVGYGSSASSAASTGSPWQDALRSLIMSNPGLKLPQEFTEALDAAPKKDMKSELYAQQKHLNARRKAVQRVERLESALQRKKLQMSAYQEHLKRQLQLELQKFKKEQEDIEEQLRGAREHLEKLDKGEDVEEMEPFIDTTEGTLAGMLGITQEADVAVQKAVREKDEAMAMVNQLQQQIHMIMQQGATMTTPQSLGADQMQALVQQYGPSQYSPIRSSPQGPVIAPFSRGTKKQPKEGQAPESLDGMGWQCAGMNELLQRIARVVCITGMLTAQVHWKATVLDAHFVHWLKMIAVCILMWPILSGCPIYVQVKLQSHLDEFVLIQSGIVVVWTFQAQDV